MTISSSSSIVTRIRVLTLCLFLLFPFAVRAAGKVIKDSFVSRGKTRTVYLVLPDVLKAPQPVPLIVMFHGSGHNGLSLADKWKDIANKEGFIVAAPDSADPAVW
jgi:poly(3-hydroxybutyrate) depolymerase